MRATWRPRLILLLVSVAVGLMVGEVAARLVGIRPIAALPLPVQVAMEHPALGWVNRPGVHLSWDTGNAPMTFWPDGRRATRATADAPPEAVVQVALIGGSFTQGYGVADEHAFGWLLDARFPGLSVDNHGTGGYGTYQSLLLLEQLFREADFRPSLVIYGFAAFHGERNVGAYRHVVTLRTQVGERLAPTARTHRRRRVDPASAVLYPRLAAGGPLGADLAGASEPATLDAARARATD